MMKNNKLKDMSSPELEKELSALKSELFKLRFSLATNGLDNPLKVKEVRKEIIEIFIRDPRAIYHKRQQNKQSQRDKEHHF